MARRHCDRSVPKKQLKLFVVCWLCSSFGVGQSHHHFLNRKKKTLFFALIEDPVRIKKRKTVNNKLQPGSTVKVYFGILFYVA